MTQPRGASRTPRRLKRRVTAWAIAGGLVVVLLALSSSLVNLAVDWLWFESVGQRATFQTRLMTRGGLWGAGLLLSLAVLLGNWLAIPQRAFGRLQLTLVDRRGRAFTIGPRVFAVVLSFAAVLTACVLAGEVGRHWMDLLTFIYAAPFGLADPLFGLDVSFYLFRLPIYRFASAWVMVLLVLAFLGSGAVYAVIGRLREKRAAIHLSVLVALFLFAVGADYQWQRFGLLTTSHGAVFGAGYTDITARLPLLHLLTGVVVLGGLLLLLNFVIRRWRLLLYVAGAWLVLWLLGSSYPQLVQRFTVQPNELALERPYLEHNIRFTRIAYGIEGIAEDAFTVVGYLTRQVLEANADTIENVRLWDWRPMRTAYEQLQEIRTYYTFVDVDVDRYTLDGRPRQVMLAARELDVDELREDARTWVNQHLIYTHGYGLCLSPVNEISEEGLPTFWVRDVPPQSTDPALEITRPEIYFGEATDNYIIVNTSEDEFDYPQGDQNIYTRYSGPDGVRLGGLFRRAVLASYFDSNPILFSSALGPDSRILFRRTLPERVRALAPMLWYDDDPYPVLVSGRIVWLYDAYTVSGRFPYSTPSGDGSAAGLNYIRNSVKVTVDAYTGETVFYIVDAADPLIQTYRAIFPALFTDGAQMAPELRAHWRYPEQLFRIQADAFASFHMQDPRVFYNQEDLWQKPTEILERGEAEVDPYYVIMRLPGAQQPEFLLIRPYVPASKQNMIAWLYADSDGADYGQMGVYKFPKEEVVYGPIQVEGRFDQDAYISQQLTLWNQRGSSVIRGNMMVVPVDGTLLYIEPLYLQAEAGRLPELKRVLVAHGNRVAMADNLAQALAQLLSEAVPAQPEADQVPSSDVGALARSAQSHYEAAQACLQRNDWACYGAELDALGADLDALVAVSAEE